MQGKHDHQKRRQMEERVNSEAALNAKNGIHSTPRCSKSEGDLPAHISWLLNYILAYPRPVETSISVIHAVIPSTDTHTIHYLTHILYVRRLFLGLSCDGTPVKG